METVTKKIAQVERRKQRTRYKVRSKNRELRKRIFVHFSSKYIYAQLINDVDGKTELSVCTRNPQIKDKSRKNKEAAKELADLFVGKLNEKKITAQNGYVFDRGYKLYHGKIKI